MKEKIIGSTAICPVCGKKFQMTEYIDAYVLGGWTCSWECFLKGADIAEEKYKKSHPTTTVTTSDGREFTRKKKKQKRLNFVQKEDEGDEN